MFSCFNNKKFTFIRTTATWTSQCNAFHCFGKRNAVHQLNMKGEADVKVQYMFSVTWVIYVQLMWNYFRLVSYASRRKLLTSTLFKPKNLPLKLCNRQEPQLKVESTKNNICRELCKTLVRQFCIANFSFSVILVYNCGVYCIKIHLYWICVMRLTGISLLPSLYTPKFILSHAKKNN